MDKKLAIFLKQYIKARPFFLGLIRAKEAFLYQQYLPFKQPVLDVGCGDGMFAKVAFANKFKVQNSKCTFTNSLIDVGLDVKDSRIEESRKVGTYKKLVTYDGKKIPFPDHSFATVVSNSVLEHVDDLEAVLNEIYRVLRPGGLFLTTVMAKPWEDYLFGAKLFGDFYKRWMRKKQVHNFLLTKKEWDKAFYKAGFTIEKSIGHLSPQACALIDISHYLSVPSLITYKLIGKWVLFPEVATRIYPKASIVEILKRNVNSNYSGALFYMLKRQ